MFGLTGESLIWNICVVIGAIIQYGLWSFTVANECFCALFWQFIIAAAGRYQKFFFPGKETPPIKGNLACWLSLFPSKKELTLILFSQPTTHSTIIFDILRKNSGMNLMNAKNCSGFKTYLQKKYHNH